MILILWMMIAGCTATYPPTPRPIENTLTIATPRPAPTATNVAAPTLFPGDAHSLLSELLREDSSCRLPCWWNIVPGRSTVRDAVTVLDPFLSTATYNSSSPGIPNGIFVKYPIEDVEMLFRLSYSPYASWETEIEQVSIHAEALRKSADGYEPVYDSPIYRELFRSYLIPSVLFDYGRPAFASLYVELGYAEPTAPDSFSLRLWYPEQSTIITYVGLAEVIGDRAQVCPLESFVGLLLLPPGREDLFQQHMPEPADLKSIEETTGMTLEEFYTAFSASTNQCLETPLAMWPP